MTNKLLDFIKTSLPKLEINSVQINDEGWDNDILIVNQQLVFRFPKTEAIADKIHAEAALLESLINKHLLIGLPVYHKLNDENGKLKCVYYDYIDGAPLKSCHPDKKSAMILGDFLTRLHQINPAQTDLKIERTYAFWENLFHSVQKEVFPLISNSEKEKIQAVFTGFLDDYKACQQLDTIVHGDLTASNIICKNREVTGVIDFTDAQIGDSAMDFAGFYWGWGPEFTHDVLAWYEGKEPAASILKRVQGFYGLQPAFHELLHAVRNNNKAEWDYALARFMELAD
ncbi:phosphotransferase family protein [Virgibacillus kekensis]|uniref:Phosphotransferase family protein n=1 Tax=Virgibacillus kekensis TaxID=202261 RepID=A0ABV9DJT0_9BACI